MKILLIGATGQLGGDILRNNEGHDIHAPRRENLELAQPHGFAALVRDMRPEVVINCAAFHNVLLCEKDPAQAFLINCTAVHCLAALCVDIGALLVTFSTDYVFNGDKGEPYLEADRPAPLQMYGITRVAGEYAALAVAPQNSVIIRTCGLYGVSGARSKGYNFVDARIRDARNTGRIEVSCEQTVSPTSTADLSRAVLSLITHPRLKAGTYHLVNEGACSWYEFTSAIVKYAGLTTEVIPVDRGGRTGNIRRPLYSVLANTRARRLGITLRPWQEALMAYLEIRYPELGIRQAYTKGYSLP